MVSKYLKRITKDTTVKILTLTDSKWNIVKDFFVFSQRGRPPKWDARKILEAVLYVLHTGCQWRKLPSDYPPYQTVYRHFRKWESLGILIGLRDLLLEALQEKGLKFSVAFVDATFVRAMSGGDKIGKTKIGKGSKIMAIVDQTSQPLAALVTSAQPHEITLLQETLEDIPPNLIPQKLVGDKAYDSDPHDEMLAEKGIELIDPHRQNRAKPPTQDKRKLTTYKKRWVVERFFAWMKPARRLLTRFDKRASVFQAFLDLFSALTLIKDC